MTKKIISYRIDDKFYKKLSELAKNHSVSVNEMARNLLMEALNADSNSDDNRTARELRSDIISASKELTILQHDIELISGNNRLKESMKGDAGRLWLTLNRHMSYMRPIQTW